MNSGIQTFNLGPAICCYHTAAYVRFAFTNGFKPVPQYPKADSSSSTTAPWSVFCRQALASGPLAGFLTKTLHPFQRRVSTWQTEASVSIPRLVTLPEIAPIQAAHRPLELRGRSPCPLQVRERQSQPRNPVFTERPPGPLPLPPLPPQPPAPVCTPCTINLCPRAMQGHDGLFRTGRGSDVRLYRQLRSSFDPPDAHKRYR